MLFWVTGSLGAQQASEEHGEERRDPQLSSAQLDGQDHTTALQQHSAQPPDLLYSSLTTNVEEREGRAIMEQFICKCLKYQIKASPLAFIRKKTLLNFLVCVSVWGFFFFILARQSTLLNHLFDFLILQLHPCCIQAQVRARFSPS